MNHKNFIRSVRWLGYSGILINEKPSVYIDPYNLAFPDIGDLILITTDHEHHCAPDEVKWLRKGSTIIIAPERSVGLFQGGDIRPAVPGEKNLIKGLEVDVWPAYTKNREDGHATITGVGYVLTFPSGLRVYHCGHSNMYQERVPELIDVFFLPVGEHSGVTFSAMAELINKVHPKVAIPIHWDTENINKKDFDSVNDLCESEIHVIKAKR
jgi:L-ascorbate metabolism protein UlaG (beta-lactamase superfamily)